MLVPLSDSLRLHKVVTHSRTRNVVVLGSTGSIGVSALDVIGKNPEHLRTLAIVANTNVEGISAQIQTYKPRFACLTDEKQASILRERLRGMTSDTEVLAGPEAAAALAAHPDCDIVCAGVVGIAGLRPVLAALTAGKTVALANKESLVCGGALVRRTIELHGGVIIPVDSEHSALFQALEGNSQSTVESLILTASGGPFLRTPISELKSITPVQAVKHPRWSMGPKISIDSATMMNKALELIEASWLFGVPGEQISVLVHPESIVHSLVEYVDGSQIAQLSVPDMRGAIAYALNHPRGRLPGVMKRLRLGEVKTLNFEPLDDVRFPAVKLARECLAAGGGACAVFNCANEEAVQAFVNGKISFLDIETTVRRTVEMLPATSYISFDDLQELEVRTRRQVRSLVNAG